MIEVIENKYEGIIVNNTTLPKNKEDFEIEVTKLIETIQNKKLLWIKIPSVQSDFIPILTKLDFEFHHCDDNNLMLVKKLAYDSIIPATKNFIVGVGAIVFDNDMLLVVKDKFSSDYKLPGGHIDKNESVKNALKREIYEETGILTEFESVLSIGHFPQGQFGESNLYLVCTAKPLTKEITVYDSSEITESKWMKCTDFLNSEDTNNYNKSLLKAALENTELKLKSQNIQLKVKNGEVFF